MKEEQEKQNIEFRNLLADAKVTIALLTSERNEAVNELKETKKQLQELKLVNPDIISSRTKSMLNKRKSPAYLEDKIQ